jgi:hypothetical protein
VVSNAARLSLQNHINELRELANAIQNNHIDWSQGRILSELRSVEDGPDDDIVVEMSMSFTCDNARMTVDEQNCFRKIRKSLIQFDDLDISRVILTMDTRRHFNALLSSNLTQSEKFGALINPTLISTRSMHSNTYNITKAELIGKIDGSNIANHMEQGYEMEALFNYYLADGQHCDGVTVNARFTNFKADLYMIGERWAATKINEEHIHSFFDQNDSKEAIEKQSEEELKKVECLSVQEISDLIDESADKRLNETTVQKYRQKTYKR